MTTTTPSTTASDEVYEAAKFEAVFNDGWFQYVTRTGHGDLPAGTPVQAKRRKDGKLTVKFSTAYISPHYNPNAKGLASVLSLWKDARRTYSALWFLEGIEPDSDSHEMRPL